MFNYIIYIPPLVQTPDLDEFIPIFQSFKKVKLTSESISFTIKFFKQPNGDKIIVAYSEITVNRLQF